MEEAERQEREAAALSAASKVQTRISSASQQIPSMLHQQQHGAHFPVSWVLLSLRLDTAAVLTLYIEL